LVRDFFVGTPSRIKLSPARVILGIAVLPASFSLHALAQSAAARIDAVPNPAPTAPARSNNVVEPIRIEFQAPAGCSNAAGFLENVLHRTQQARAANGHEIARVFRVSVVQRRGESAGEISVQRPGEATLVRFSASGQCADVLDSLAQFAAIVVDPGVASVSTRDGELPENPYRNWKGPLAEALPENPYRNWSGDLAPSLPANPYRSPRLAAAAAPTPPGNPYRNYGPPPDDLPENPYRRR
jgi:hypothetical protein